MTVAPSAMSGGTVSAHAAAFMTLPPTVPRSLICGDPIAEEVTNLRLLERWKQIQAKEVRYKEYGLAAKSPASLRVAPAGAKRRFLREVT